MLTVIETIDINTHLMCPLCQFNVSIVTHALCNVIYTQILSKFKLTEERCNDYCLWEMMGDGNQMTGNIQLDYMVYNYVQPCAPLYIANYTLLHRVEALKCVPIKRVLQLFITIYFAIDITDKHAFSNKVHCECLPKAETKVTLYQLLNQGH